MPLPGAGAGGATRGFVVAGAGSTASGTGAGEVVSGGSVVSSTAATVVAGRVVVVMASVVVVGWGAAVGATMRLGVTSIDRSGAAGGAADG